jgi:hypothetical protein
LRAAQIGSVQWQILTSNGLVDFSPSNIVVDTAAIQLVGRFSIVADGSNLILVYTIPEPISAVLWLQMAFFVSLRSRRGWAKYGRS